MSAANAINAKLAKTAKEQTSQTLRENRNVLRSDFAVLQKMRAIYPVKTAVYLSDITSAPIRTCEYWLLKNRLPSEAIWALLQSEHGLDFLVAGMAEAKPSWWQWFLRLGIAGSVMRRRAADRRLLEKTLDADRDLSATIARAASLSDEDFHRPFLDALSTMAGVPNRALASTGK